MENKKSNKGLIVLVVILIICIIGLIGYIIFDKSNTKEDYKEELNNTAIKDAANNNKDEETNKNSYELYAQNLKQQFSKYDSNNYISLDIKSFILDGGYNVYLRENQTLYIKYSNQELNTKYGEYKIAENVLNFFVISVGQGMGNVLYFINEDGTVGSADIEYGIGTDEIQIKKDLGYKNIVNIVSGIFGDGYSGAHGPIFIDIDGNIYSDNLN